MRKPRGLPPFTAEALNRATLARQLLLRRSRLSVPKAVERLCAMQAQDPKMPYIGLWSRLEGFRKERLTRAYERRQLTRSTLFRVTVHLVSAADQPAFARVVHDQWRADLLRERLPLDEMIERVERLAESGPFTYAELEAALPELGTRPFRVRCVTPLVHVPPSGTWGTTRVRLTTADRWLDRPAPPRREAASILVRRYLQAFGPATRADLLRFSGLRVSSVDPALEALEPELVRFEADDTRELLDLRRAPRPGPGTAAPVRFLPQWDALLLSHADRSRVLPSEYREAVIAGGWVHPTFLVGGVVAGIWKPREARVELEPFSPLPLRLRREVEDEARRLEAFLA
jgi:uncharacterized protein YcaQ